jgi:hypothetical protein
MQVTAYALESAQQRGRLFVKPGDQVYEGQVVGIYQRSGDLKVNVCKKKVGGEEAGMNNKVNVLPCVAHLCGPLTSEKYFTQPHNHRLQEILNSPHTPPPPPQHTRSAHPPMRLRRRLSPTCVRRARIALSCSLTPSPSAWTTLWSTLLMTSWWR